MWILIGMLILTVLYIIKLRSIDCDGVELKEEVCLTKKELSIIREMHENTKTFNKLNDDERLLYNANRETLTRQLSYKVRITLPYAPDVYEYVIMD